MIHVMSCLEFETKMLVAHRTNVWNSNLTKVGFHRPNFLWKVVNRDVEDSEFLISFLSQSNYRFLIFGISHRLLSINFYFSAKSDLFLLLVFFTCSFFFLLIYSHCVPSLNNVKMSFVENGMNSVKVSD